MSSRRDARNFRCAGAHITASQHSQEQTKSKKKSRATEFHFVNVFVFTPIFWSGKLTHSRQSAQSPAHKVLGRQRGSCAFPELNSTDSHNRAQSGVETSRFAECFSHITTTATSAYVCSTWRHEFSKKPYKETHTQTPTRHVVCVWSQSQAHIRPSCGLWDARPS